MARSSPSSKRRPDQVAEVVRQVVAEALLREIRDPRIQMVTITGIEVSPDLSYARILVTVHGDEAERDLALEGLERASGFLRSRVAKALATRITPALTFVADRGQEHAAKIEAILGALKRGEEAP